MSMGLGTYIHFCKKKNNPDDVNTMMMMMMTILKQGFLLMW